MHTPSAILCVTNESKLFTCHRTHLDHIGGHSELVYHWPQGQGPEGFYGDSSTKIEVCSDGVLVCGSMLCFVKFLGFESLMMSSMTRVNGSDMQNIKD
ncbi:hypothetical protein ACB098_08G172600 [Castanea mollissima]